MAASSCGSHDPPVSLGEEGGEDTSRGLFACDTFLICMPVLVQSFVSSTHKQAYYRLLCKVHRPGCYPSQSHLTRVDAVRYRLPAGGHSLSFS